MFWSTDTNIYTNHAGMYEKGKRIFENVFNRGGQMPTEWVSEHDWCDIEELDTKNWLSLTADSLNIRLKTNSWNQMTQSVKLINDLFICFLNLAFLSMYSSQFTLNEVEIFSRYFYADILIGREGRREEMWLFDIEGEKMKKSYSRI